MYPTLPKFIRPALARLRCFWRLSAFTFSLSLPLHFHDDILPNQIRAPAADTSPMLSFFEPSFVAHFAHRNRMEPEDFGSRAIGDFLVDRIDHAIPDKAPWHYLPPHDLTLQGWLRRFHFGAVLYALPSTVKQ
jgi:hypothetical protein